MNNSISDFMSRDHDRLDSIFKEFVKNREKKNSQAKQLFSRFKEGLENHIVCEEEILFPLFESKTGMKEEGPTVVMRLEHKDIKQYLSEILNIISDGNFETESLEGKLVDVLSAHNEKEEMILYPWIDESLDEKEQKKTMSNVKKIIVLFKT